MDYSSTFKIISTMSSNIFQRKIFCVFGRYFLFISRVTIFSTNKINPPTTQTYYFVLESHFGQFDRLEPCGKLFYNSNNERFFPLSESPNCAWNRNRVSLFLGQDFSYFYILCVTSFIAGVVTIFNILLGYPNS